jgi:hypothetical protein
MLQYIGLRIYIYLTCEYQKYKWEQNLLLAFVFSSVLMQKKKKNIFLYSSVHNTNYIYRLYNNYDLKLFTIRIENTYQNTRKN